MAILASISRRRLLCDRRGTGAIEFALIAPVLATFALGITDLTLGLGRKYELDQASYRALEMITVGGIQGDYAYVKPEAAAAAGVSQNKVTVVTKLECAGVVRSFSDTCPGTQETSRFVTVTIVDDYRPTFSFLPITSADGTIRLTARSTIRVQ